MKAKEDDITGSELNYISSKGEVWFFHIQELSQGYYRVIGVSINGASVSREGINPKILIDQCKVDIDVCLK